MLKHYAYLLVVLLAAASTVIVASEGPAPLASSWGVPGK